MNNLRRKELQKAIDLLDRAKYIIEACKDDEEEAFDNLPDGIKDSERGEDMEDNIDSMDDVMSEIEEQISVLEEIINA